MQFLAEFLPIVIYFLLIIFLVIGILLGIRFIITLNKLDKVVEDVNQKVQTLNGFFHIIDYTTDKLVLATDKVVEGITALFKKLVFSKKKKNIKKERGIENE